LKDTKYERQTSTKDEKEIRENKLIEEGTEELIRQQKKDIVTCMSDCRRGFGLHIGFIGHLGL
jgi:hypothetical protein